MVSLKELRSIVSIVEKLGGLDGVEELTLCNNRTSIHNWIAAGSFPPRYHACMTEALRQRGYWAQHSFWRQEGNHRRNAIAAAEAVA